MPRAEFNDIEFWGQIVAADIGIVPFALIIGIWFPFKGEKKVSPQMEPHKKSTGFFRR